MQFETIRQQIEDSETEEILKTERKKSKIFVMCNWWALYKKKKKQSNRLKRQLSVLHTRLFCLFY